MSGLDKSGLRIFMGKEKREEKRAVERLKARIDKGDWVSKMLVRKHG